MKSVAEHLELLRSAEFSVPYSSGPSHGRGHTPCGKSGSAALRPPVRKLLLGAALISSKNCPAGRLPALASARSWPRFIPLPRRGGERSARHPIPFQHNTSLGAWFR